jgi:hypothetical protein
MLSWMIAAPSRTSAARSKTTRGALIDERHGVNHHSAAIIDHPLVSLLVDSGC